MIRELSREDFLKTMKSGMKDITQDAEAVVDIWDYAASLLIHIKLERHLFSLPVEVVEYTKLLCRVEFFQGTSKRRKTHLKIRSCPGEICPCIFNTLFVD